MNDTVSRRLAEQLARAADRALPEDVAHRTALHLLHTLAAGIAGTRGPAGRTGLDFAARYAGTGPVPLWGRTVTADAQTAALANALAAHASRPGCAIVPAALAIAVGRDVSGPRLLTALATGFDLAARIDAAVGTAAACAVVARLDAARALAALSYAVQYGGGATSGLRDVEQAFVVGGQPARNGVFAVQVAELGRLDGPDPFDGAPDALVDGLAERYAVPAAEGPAVSTELLVPVLGARRTAELVDRLLAPGGVDADTLGALTRC